MKRRKKEECVISMTLRSVSPSPRAPSAGAGSLSAEERAVSFPSCKASLRKFEEAEDQCIYQIPML